jgi:hypothetical protein
MTSTCCAWLQAVVGPPFLLLAMVAWALLQQLAVGQASRTDPAITSSSQPVLLQLPGRWARRSQRWKGCLCMTAYL